MSGGIFLIRENDELIEMTEQLSGSCGNGCGSHIN